MMSFRGIVSMRAGEKKALLIFALVLLLWRVFELPRIEDAFLQFIAVGALPGTDKLLSPDQVLILVAALFSVSLLLIFRKELVRSFRTRAIAHPQSKAVARESIKPATGQQSVVTAPTASKSGTIVVRTRRGQSIRISMPQLHIRDKKLPELYVPSIMPTIWRVMDWEMKQLARLYVLLGKAYQKLKVLSKKGWAYSRIYAATFWRWLEPHIRALDTWLEKKARKNRISSDVIEILEDCWRTVRFYVRRWTTKS